MTQTKTTPTSAPKRAPRTLAGNPAPAADDNRVQALATLRVRPSPHAGRQIREAHVAFNKLLASAPATSPTASACTSTPASSRSPRARPPSPTHEERYDYAVSLLNDGHYEDAREQFKQSSQTNDKADYAFYGLAVLASMTGDAHTCLEHLTEAIRLNPSNRIQARADSDFQDMADDPRFTELLYPEV